MGERGRGERKEKFKFWLPIHSAAYTKIAQIEVAHFYPISIFKNFDFNRMISSELILIAFPPDLSSFDRTTFYML